MGLVCRFLSRLQLDQLNAACPIRNQCSVNAATRQTNPLSQYHGADRKKGPDPTLADSRQRRLAPSKTTVFFNGRHLFTCYTIPHPTSPTPALCPASTTGPLFSVSALPSASGALPHTGSLYALRGPGLGLLLSALLAACGGGGSSDKNGGGIPQTFTATCADGTTKTSTIS